MRAIIPAILPSSKQDLADKLARLDALENVREVQIDAVDGRFATPACWPWSAPQELSHMLEAQEYFPFAGRFKLEADLMTLYPEESADQYLALGAARVTIHAESAPQLAQTIAALRSRHDLIEIGVALTVATDPMRIDPVVDQIDYVQLMGIARIGRQGQPFDRHVLVTIRELKRRYPELALQIDGGVSRITAPELLAAGADRLIVGSDLWHAPDLGAEIAKFEKLLLTGL